MTTRRQVMKLAAFAGSHAALAGAVRAEGGADVGALDAVGLPFAQQTPMRIGAAALRVRDLGKMRRYYTDLLKFSTLREDKTEVVLGVDGAALLHLIHRPGAPVVRKGTAGLFHTAFLMPSRADFARWLVHAGRSRVPFTGFADHLVSEASYLDDPEGNGIEVYSDRPPATWQWDNERVAMATDQLDIDNILALADVTTDQYVTAPKALRIGHMHLRVGEVARGRAFYEGLIGLAPTRLGRAGVAFLSSGRYHHHIGINTWESEGAGVRDPQETGLAWFSLVADAAVLSDTMRRLAAAGVSGDALTNGIAVADPWGTSVRLVSRA